MKAKFRKEATKGASNLTQLMDVLDKILSEKPDSTITLNVNDDGKITNLFIQLPFMKEAFTKFPEMLHLDATYRVNATKMPLFTLMVEDGYGCGIPVAHFFVADESAENLESGFAALKKSMGESLLSKNSVVIVDKDFNEIVMVKKFFPASAIHLCLFHVFKSFRQETRSFAKSERKKKNEILALLEKNCICVNRSRIQ